MKLDKSKLLERKGFLKENHGSVFLNCMNMTGGKSVNVIMSNDILLYS